MAPDRFKPLIYELDADTVFKLMESEKRCRRARISIALLERVQALSRSSPVDSLAQQIRQVQVRLEQERNSRVGDKDNGKLRDELIQKCLEVIKKGGASKAVYEAVFRTIVQGEREAMFSKYKASAKELSEALKEYPEACEQNTSGKPGEDLARLYMEAISVRERAQKVMNSIDSADGHNSIDSADGNRRRSVYQSGNDRRLEMAPLKMMRYALMPPSMPLPHLSSWSLVRCSRACEKIVLQPGRSDQAHSSSRTRRVGILTRRASKLSGTQQRTSGAGDSPPGAKRICDIVRMTFVCQTLEEMATLLTRIRESSKIEVVRFKDRMQNPSGGWRDAMINFRLKDSDHICEVQIVHQKMALCRHKDGLGGHDEYARERNAREILEYLGEEAPPEEEALSMQDVLKVATVVQTLRRQRSHRESSSRDGDGTEKRKPEEAEPRAQLTMTKWVLRLALWSQRSKRKVAAETAPPKLPLPQPPRSLPPRLSAAAPALPPAPTCPSQPFSPPRQPPSLLPLASQWPRPPPLPRPLPPLPPLRPPRPLPLPPPAPRCLQLPSPPPSPAPPGASRLQRSGRPSTALP